MRITQGTFSFLPDLTEGEIGKQIEYCMGKDWPMNVEFTDDPHPRSTYWELWGFPLFDEQDPAVVMGAIRACCEAHPDHYVKVNAYDTARGRETVALSFIVQRPAREPGFRLERQEVQGRTIRYSLRSYAADEPEGERYQRKATGNGADRTKR
jgi:ribulose-bisphosphate carboxylase small chain